MWTKTEVQLIRLMKFLVAITTMRLAPKGCLNYKSFKKLQELSLMQAKLPRIKQLLAICLGIRQKVIRILIGILIPVKVRQELISLTTACNRKNKMWHYLIKKKVRPKTLFRINCRPARYHHIRNLKINTQSAMFVGHLPS